MLLCIKQGKIVNLRSWWDKLLEKGPPLSYLPKASKSWLVAKDTRLEEAIAPWHRYQYHSSREKVSWWVHWEGSGTKWLLSRSCWRLCVTDWNLTQDFLLRASSCLFSIHSWISAQTDIPHQDHPIRVWSPVTIRWDHWQQIHPCPEGQLCV